MMTDHAQKYYMLASGGTGGHVFPARALAQELLRQGHRVALVTDQRGERYEKMFPGVNILQVSSASPSIGGLFGKVKAALKLMGGINQSLSLIKKDRPDAVVGFGGYPSMPPAFAAGLKGVPVFLHEQNAVLGRVNRLLASKATKIATSYPVTDTADEEVRRKMIFTGNPVRDEIAAKSDAPYSAPDSDTSLKILVLGGSQGATVLSDTVPAAITSLTDELQARLHVTQQCRPEDLDRVRAAYEGTSVTVDLAAFFDNVPDLLADAHLVIARSGASTMAEIAVIGRPAIYVPYKFAMDNHQLRNAAASVEAGGAKLISQDDFTPEDLTPLLESLLSDGATLTAMAKAAKTLAEPHAARKLAQLVTTGNVEELKQEVTGKVMS